MAKGYDLDRCAAPLNGSFVEGDTVHWQFRDYGVSPLVAGASAMAASYWAAIKATPADVVNENVNVLSTLRSIYSGGFDATATACVVEICKTPGVDVDALITTCILDPGNSQTTSRTEQSSGAWCFGGKKGGTCSCHLHQLRPPPIKHLRMQTQGHSCE